MKLTISKTIDKDLVGRKDVEFKVELDKPSQTPTIAEVRKLLAATGGFDLSGTVIVRMGHLTGRSVVAGLAHVYPSEDAVKIWEPKHVLIANLEPEAKRRALEQLKKRRMEAKAARGGKK